MAEESRREVEWTLAEWGEAVRGGLEGDLAFVRGVETNRLRARDGDASIERTQRAFSVLRRGADGRWRFARGMTRFRPAPPSSSRLKPA